MIVSHVTKKAENSGLITVDETLLFYVLIIAKQLHVHEYSTQKLCIDIPKFIGVIGAYHILPIKGTPFIKAPPVVWGRGPNIIQMYKDLTKIGLSHSTNLS